MTRHFSGDSQFYHVFNRSIGGEMIFQSDSLKSRFCDTLSYYNGKTVRRSFSAYLRDSERTPLLPLVRFSNQCLVKVLAYCIMPNHYHILINAEGRQVLSEYISIVENSFTRFYNLVTHRRGPLWQSRYKHVLITTNPQLLHVSRYIHLNPTSSSLVKRPEDWKYSSYRAYIKPATVLKESWNDITIRSAGAYRRFVDDRKDYQRKLKRIKNHLF